MTYLFWLDLEMTGLDHTKDRILEAALIVTNLSLQPIKQYESVIFQNDEILKSMDTWCVKQHQKSGLTDKVPNGKIESVVESDLLKIIKEFSTSNKAILAGNSIGQDRRFIDQWMPQLSATLHYRMLDVSSFKIVFENIFNKKFTKKSKHRAIEDILESIEELKYYLQFMKADK